MTKLLLVGYGKMGKLVHSLAAEYHCEVVGTVDPLLGGDGLDSPKWNGVDVAVDFSTPGSVVANITTLARRGVNLVVGTTGWGAEESSIRKVIEETRVGIVAAPNFSTGVVLFESIVAHAAQAFARQTEFGVFLHEAHHAAKKDAPSGTALLLKRSMEQAGLTRAIDVSSTRAGFIPGVHTVGFDGPSETVTLTHSARDRGAFARGALIAAQWVAGKRGWFTMHDVLGLT